MSTTRFLSDPTPSEPTDGFTLIELLIVIVVLGVLSTVVVFAVRGIVDRGDESAVDADAATLTRAEEAHMARFGTYADEAQLMSSGLLRSPSGLHDVTLSNAATDYEIVGVGSSSNNNNNGPGPTQPPAPTQPPPPPPAPTGPTSVSCSNTGTPITVAGFTGVCYGNQAMISNTILVIVHASDLRGYMEMYVDAYGGNMTGVLLLVDDPAMSTQAQVSTVVGAVPWRGVMSFQDDTTFSGENAFAGISAATGQSGYSYQAEQYIWGTFVIG